MKPLVGISANVHIHNGELAAF